MEHTALPWQLNAHKDRAYVSAHGGLPNICEIYGKESHANAALIVKAVNAHQKLVDALRTIINADDENELSEDEIESARALLAELETK